MKNINYLIVLSLIVLNLRTAMASESPKARSLNCVLRYITLEGQVLEPSIVRESAFAKFQDGEIVVDLLAMDEEVEGSYLDQQVYFRIAGVSQFLEINFQPSYVVRGSPGNDLYLVTVSIGFLKANHLPNPEIHQSHEFSGDDYKSSTSADFFPNPTGDRVSLNLYSHNQLLPPTVELQCYKRK